MGNNQNFYTKIAGVTFDNDNGTNRQELLRLSKPGDRLFLVPSPNEYNDTAVKVMSDSLNEQLGWLKSELSEEIFNWIKDGNEYSAEISEITGLDDENKTLGCNIHIEKIKASGEAMNRQKVDSKDKSNKLNTEGTEKEKTSQEKAEELSNKMQNAGKKMQKLGCLLTIVITVPLVLTVFLGPIGLGISVVLIVLYFIGKNKNN